MQTHNYTFLYCNPNNRASQWRPRHIYFSYCFRVLELEVASSVMRMKTKEGKDSHLGTPQPLPTHHPAAPGPDNAAHLITILETLQTTTRSDHIWVHVIFCLAGSLHPPPPNVLVVDVVHLVFIVAVVHILHPQTCWGFHFSYLAIDSVGSTNLFQDAHGGIAVNAFHGWIRHVRWYFSHWFSKKRCWGQTKTREDP